MQRLDRFPQRHKICDTCHGKADASHDSGKILDHLQQSPKFTAEHELSAESIDCVQTLIDLIQIEKRLPEPLSQ